MILTYSSLKKATMPANVFREKMPYVAVFHNPSNKFFFLNRNYRLLNIEPPDSVNKSYLEQHAVQKNKAWAPTDDNQRPKWAQGLPDSEFTGYFLYTGEGMNSPANPLREGELTPAEKQNIKEQAEKWVKDGKSFFKDFFDTF